MSVCASDGCTDAARSRGLCPKHYQAAWKRGFAAPVPPKPAEFVCPPDHKHGLSGVCYTMHRCRCDECRRVRSETDLRRAKLHAYGRWVDPYVPAEPVREHLQYLREFGLGWKRIAAISGIGNTAVESLIYGRKGGNGDPRKGEVATRVLRRKADAILAVKPDISLLAGGVTIPSRGVHRRIQALVAIGWSQSKLAERIGMEPGNFAGVMHRPQVLVSTHRAVAAMYEELWCTAPAHVVWREKIAYSRSLNYAQAHRWLPPLAWDDIDNDVEPPVPDEDCAIDEMAVEMAMHGEPVNLTPAERREAVTRLHAERWSDQRIAATLRCADRTVWRIRQELNLEAFDFADLVKGSAA